jgi:hypothetical protein
MNSVHTSETSVKYRKLCLLGLLTDPEDEVSTHLRNVNKIPEALLVCLTDPEYERSTHLRNVNKIPEAVLAWFTNQP